MPNGHGGAPFLGAPIFCAILFAVFAALPIRERLGWGWVGLCLGFAALAGWRLAYHLHMRSADEYGGAYTAPEAYQQARRRYLVASVIYTILATGAGFAALWWRGLPR
jgi:hypothetical protein